MHKFWGRVYNEHPEEFSQIFDMETSSKAYEEDAEVTGFGLAPIKAEGAATSYDSENQGPTTRYTHVAYSLGYIVTREELDDNLYATVSKRRIKALSFSMRQTKENVAANILNRAFNSSYTGGDGIEMIASTHPTITGTQSNILSTAADLSEASLEDMAIQIMQVQNSRGLRISIMPQCLIVAPGEAFNAERILKSTLQNDTGNNAVNAVRSMGLLPKGAKVNHYLTDADAWFVKTNAPNGLQCFERKAAEFDKDNDFDTSNAKAKAYERYSFGWTDWRGIFGTPGA